MKFRVFFDQETKRHRHRFLDVVCQSIDDISGAILYDSAVGLQIHEIFSADLDDIINKAISRDLDVPIGEFSRGNDRILYRRLYESVYKYLDASISQLQVSICSIKEINLFEDVHKGDLDEPKEQVIDAVRTIKKAIGGQWFSILCCKDIYISKEQQEQIIQILKRRLVEKLDLLEYTVSWDDNFIRAKLDCIRDYIIKSNWHFGLKREDGTVYSDVSLWPIVLKMTDNDVIVGSIRAKERNGTVYIGKLMVHPDYRRNGYGTKLLTEIETYFPNKRYELFTSTRSTGNIRLYQNLGYKMFDRKAITDELQFVYMEKGC